MAHKKVKSLADIINDCRVDVFIKNYDGKGVHSVILKDGFLFEGERSQEIGSIKEICISINEYIKETNEL